MEAITRQELELRLRVSYKVVDAWRKLGMPCLILPTMHPGMDQGKRMVRFIYEDVLVWLKEQCGYMGEGKSGDKGEGKSGDKGEGKSGAEVPSSDGEVKSMPYFIEQRWHDILVCQRQEKGPDVIKCRCYTADTAEFICEALNKQQEKLV